MATSLSNTSYVLGTGTSLSAGLVAGGAAAFIEKHNNKNSNEIKDILVAEGKLRARTTFTISETLADNHTFHSSTGVQYAALQLDSAGPNASVQLFTTPSSVVGKVQRGQSLTVDLGLNSSASNVEVLSFSPLSPWMTFDTSTGVLVADTDGLAAERAPGFYTFGVKGKIGELFSVEEFTVGVYETNESELEGSVNGYYYDTENTEYDLNTAINYELSPQYMNMVQVIGTKK